MPVTDLFRRAVVPLVTAVVAVLAFAPSAAAQSGRRSSTSAPTDKPATTRPGPKPRTPTTAPLEPAAVKPLPQSVDDLRALQKRVRAVVAKVAPAVVGLRVNGGQGSGVIISDDGYVLTAGHVSGMPNRDVSVVLGDGRIVRGTTLGVNYGVDSGLVKITDPGPNNGKWPFVDAGRSTGLRKGQWCIALGHPGGYKAGRTPPLRLGRILDNLGRFLRTDCTLVGGDSGGPLFDLDGRVIGIHSRIGGTLNENMHVPVDSYLDTWDRLASAEAWGATFMPGRSQAYLGVQVDPEATDCRVGEVFPDSPAESAGLKKGDVIKSFNGYKVNNFGELLVQLSQRKPDDMVEVEVVRDDRRVKLTVKIGTKPKQ
jgi:serine protease Do